MPARTSEGQLTARAQARRNLRTTLRIDGPPGEQRGAGVFSRELAGAQGLPDALAAQGVDEAAGVATQQQSRCAAGRPGVQA
jgi:hypothetical protein